MMTLFYTMFRSNSDIKIREKMERKIRKGNKKPWSLEEDEKLSHLVVLKGSKWKWYSND